jgi:D-alanine transfer protein
LTFVRLHIVPFIFAAIIACCVVYLIPKDSVGVSQSVSIGCSQKKSYIYDNFDTIPAGITPFAAAIKDKESILLLGSSELTTSSDYIPYQFFNNQTPFRLVAFGHAFYQTFAMYCNLLAFKGDLSGKKICIILSPGWFELSGTNTEAFLEFVRPEMLANIIHDEGLSVDEKSVIGDYVKRNSSFFAGLSPSMEYLTLLNELFIPFRDHWLRRLKSKIPQYKFESCSFFESNKFECGDPDWNQLKENSKLSFADKCTNDHLIDDESLKSILNGSSEFKKIDAHPVALRNNQEFEDFKLLVNLLKSSGAKPIFIMQGLIPTGFNHLERFDELKLAIQKELDNKQFPYLDLFEMNPEKYQPGTLHDLSHMGDYGWNEVNQFIYNQFCHEKIN